MNVENLRNNHPKLISYMEAAGYLDVTIEQKAEALATLEDENNRKVPKKWKSNKPSLANFCGVKPIKR
jgi:hypothetical protein